MRRHGEKWNPSPSIRFITNTKIYFTAYKKREDKEAEKKLKYILKRWFCLFYCRLVFDTITCSLSYMKGTRKD